VRRATNYEQVGPFKNRGIGIGIGYTHYADLDGGPESLSDRLCY
jgi:hypothetical protein